MPTVDSLNIEISAEANSAITSLSRLAGKLNLLPTALGKIDTSGLTRLSDNAKKLAKIDFSNFKNGLNNTSSAMNKVAKNSKNLALSFGKLYLAAKTLEQGAKKLWNSIESSMDYVETLNYFNAAFDQVAQKADLSNFQQLGYDSAEEYAKSFSERAKELTAQMTGFSVTDRGTLEATGMPSLGLNPSQLMQYQAMFGQMASSMGVASETSLKLSRALTEIGADLASVKNMDFDKVWRDMASGLAGMSRTLDKYGVNIRNVNLQQKLTELGINANIQALNQNDKALLRTIILLDSTKYAWGDLADTINQPANQLRLINANFQNLGRTIGNLFLPLVQKVLPYINALAIALQRLFSWVGNLLGIELPDFKKSLPDNSSMSDLLDSTDELSAGLDKASKNAKKLKGNLQGFDKLNVITTQDDSDSGAGIGAGLTGGLLDAAFEDALSEYQKKWDEAFSNMENRAQEMADKVEKFFEPIKKIIQDFAVGDFFQAGKDVSNLVVSITDFFARAIDNVPWYEIGQKIGDFLAGIEWLDVLDSFGNLFWQGIKGVIELWKGSFDAAPIETTIATALMGMKLAGITIPVPVKIGLTVIAFAPNIAKEIGESLGIDETIFGDSLEDLSWSYFFEKLEEGFTNEKGDIDIAKGIRFTLDVVEANVTGTAELLGLSNSDNPIIKFLFSPTKDIFKEVDLSSLTKKFKDFSVNISAFFKNSWNNIVSVWEISNEWFNEKIIEPISNLFYELKTRIQQVFEGMWIIAQAIWIKASSWFNEKVIIPIIDTFSPIVEKISGFFSQAWDSIKEIWNVASNWFNETIITPVTNSFKTACDKISGFFSSLWSGIKEGVVGTMNVAIVAIESGLNLLVDGINGIISGFNRVASWAADIIEVNWKGVDLVPEVSIGRINVGSYELGGFPKEYSLFMAGENGKAELLGTKGGKTAVAGGEEITGIRDAVYSTSQQEVELLREQNRLLQAILEKKYGISERDIGKAARNYAMEYFHKKGENVYSF